jgi:pimeloyl-ACP methyl ester carboxylesterase
MLRVRKLGYRDENVSKILQMEPYQSCPRIPWPPTLFFTSPLIHDGGLLPFVENNGINIYYEVEGEGVPLMLHHGLTWSLNGFRYFGYTDKLRQKYQLILLDARGHGRSDKPHEPDAYRLRNFVNDTIAVLDDLGIEKSHFLGFSMGGSVGLGIGVYSPDRFKSLIIGGMGMAEMDSEEEIKRNQGLIELYGKGMEAVVSAFERGGNVLSHERREDVMRNDPEALVSLCSVNEHIGFKGLLPSLELPCLFYAGDQDYYHQISSETVEIISNARFVSLPALDHIGTFRQSDLVLPHILGFLTEIS